MTKGEFTFLFDVYGTLVDPAGIAAQLQADLGDRATEFAALWREKQLEYSFRRGLMQLYATFAVCTAEAFDHTATRLGHAFPPARREAILDAYRRLPAFAETVPVLQRLRTIGHRLFAFSNGTKDDVSAVLDYAKVLPLLDGVISVDELKLFKPAPAVYAHARRASGAWAAPCWLVSGNAWDVIGARSAGLDAAWVRRTAAQIFDPWGIEPTLTVGSLAELADRL
jgi:2-haloalkanoic acid dehalogenase, type II